MSSVLYRKYRSNSFREVIGQDTVVSILRESIKKNAISHAYLLCGPRGTGKTSIARLFARAVNCINFVAEGDVCNHCENCISIQSSSTTDVIEMDAASNRGVEEIRNLKESVNYLPTFLNKKVYIIDEAHMLTKEAFNALLKTLEEPPSHILFILATTEAHKLPITILSRVERYDFRLATKTELISKLKFILEKEDIEYDEDIWDVIYTRSGGSYRDAESLLGKIINNIHNRTLSKEYVFEALGIYSEDEILDLLESIMNKDISGFQLKLNNFRNIKGNIVNLIDQMLDKLYHKILQRLNANEGISQVTSCVNLLIKVKRDIKDFSDKQMIFELMIIDYMSKDGTSLKILQSSSGHDRGNMENAAIDKIEDTSIGNTPKDKSDVSSISSGSFLIDLTNSSSTPIVPRLKAILRSSKYHIENDSLIIKNRYKFNINFLNTDGNKNMILEAAQSIDGSIKKVEVQLDDVLSEKEDDLLKQSSPDTNFLKQYNSNTTSSIKDTRKIDDNSDIIEDIFN
jgi:DNA polymerase-3 subunit gamma/tau